MSRIAPLIERLRAERRLGLFTYVTVGYPERASTPDIACALLEAGADLIELGIPFSDPLAEGRTVQRTTARALRNGIKMTDCLEAARAIRARSEAPLVFMGYTNPVLAYGLERFAADAASAGVDGLILPDLSLEEAGSFRAACDGAGVDLVLFIAPTSTEQRMRTVIEHASGFIYCVSVTGVTGSRAELPAEVDAMLQRVRALTDIGLGLGFGISKPEHLVRLSGKVDAAIVGSALLEAIDERRPAESAAEFVHHLRGDALAG